MLGNKAYGFKAVSKSVNNLVDVYLRIISHMAKHEQRCFGL